MRLYDALRRRFISAAEYVTLINEGYNADSPYIPLSYGQVVSGVAYGTSVGTGEEQTIPHSLNVVPKAVHVVATGSNAVVAAIRADVTNIYVTVPIGEPYTWSAEILV